MKKIATYIFIFTLAVLFAVYPFGSASAQVGLYMGGWGGYTIASDLSSGYCHRGDCYSYDVGLDIDETPVFGAKIGYSHPRLKALELELEYSYLNPDINDHAGVAGDMKVNNIMFNIIGKMPFGIVHPYGGIGLGVSYYDISEKDNSGIGGQDDTSYAWQLLTGVEMDLANNLAVDIGYRYFVTQLKFADNTDVDLTASMITLGLKVFF
jgi:OmpA-OmpF porin, OOP family